MDLVGKLFQMEIFMKEIIKKEFQKEEEDIYGKIISNIKEILIVGVEMERVFYKSQAI